MRSFLPLAGLSALALIAVPSAANAALLISLNEVGSSVVATVSGSLSLTGLTRMGSYAVGNQNTGLRASNTFFGVAGANTLNGYSGFDGPVAIGTSSAYTSGSLASGLGFFINSLGVATSAGIKPLIGVDSSYVSGAAFASSATFLGSSFATLGLTVGDTVYRSSGDTITFRVGGALAASPTPEPATWATMIAGFGIVGGALRRRRIAVAA